MTTLDTPPAMPLPGGSSRRSVRRAPGTTRVQAHLTVLEAERDRYATARFDTGGDVGDRAWRMAGETQLLALDSQIQRLRQTLADEPSKRRSGPRDAVAVGVTVSLRFVADSTFEEYVEEYVVDQLDAVDEGRTVLTPESPLGRVLLGARAGDTVEYASPRGRRSVVVVDIR